MTISSFAGVRGVPAFVRGVAYFRAQLLTVVDMLAFLLPQWRPNSISKVFVVRGQQEWFGLQIGEFDGVRHVWSDTLPAPMPAHLSNSLGSSALYRSMVVLRRADCSRLKRT